MFDKNIVVAKILSSKGLKGEVKIKSFMEDYNSLLDYNLYDKNKKCYKLEYIHNHSGVLVTKVVGVNNVDDAKLLNNLDLCINKADMPDLEEEEFYYIDLEGLIVKNIIGEDLGRVVSIYNFGSEDILEIAKEDKTKFMINFNKDTVPEVNIKEGYLIVDIREIDENKE